MGKTCEGKGQRKQLQKLATKGAAVVQVTRHMSFTDFKAQATDLTRTAMINTSLENTCKKQGVLDVVQWAV